MADTGKPHRTEIHFAIAEGDLEKVKEYLERGTSVDEEDYDKRTPLHVAAASGHFPIMDLLIQKGANINAEDRWGRTPIEDAKMGSHREAVDFLESKGAISKTKMLKPISSHHLLASNYFTACEVGDLNQLKELLKDSVDVNSIVDVERRTLLHIAAGAGSLSVARYLVEEKGAMLNVKDRYGAEPLDLAVLNDDQPIVDFLVSQGARARSKTDVRVSVKPVNQRILHESFEQLHERGLREYWAWDATDFEIEPNPFVKGSNGGGIYRGQFRKTDCVAKTIGLSGDSTMSDLAQEMSILALIRHPNVVTFFGACFQVSPPMILLEYCHGGDLEGAIVKANSGEVKSLSIFHCFSFASQIACAMTFLHEFPVPIIHRKLHPKNILLASGGILKVTDFSFATFGADKKMEGKIILPDRDSAQYRYMAPELYEGKRYDKSVDVYSFSMVTYFIFSGLRPFSSQNGVEAVTRAGSGKRPNLHVVKDYRIQDLLELCWNEDASKRPKFDQICSSLEDMTAFTPTTPRLKPKLANPKSSTAPGKAGEGKHNAKNNSGTSSPVPAKKGLLGRIFSS